MRLLLVLALALVACFAGSQDWAQKQLATSPRHLEWVDLKHGNRTVKTYVAYPERKDKAPVIVLIHEIFGMTDWVMLTADQLAAAGFIVVAPDFLSGMGPEGGRTDSFKETEKIREAVSGLSPDQVTADLNAAVDYARTIPAANGKVAVGGFCWGGTQTFRYATNRADIDAALVFYGSGPTDAAAISRIKAPVYGFYGENDNRINATIDGSSKLMKEAGKTYEPVIYDDAGHGFMRAGLTPDALEANKKAQQEAWKRMVAILAKLG